MFAANQEGTMHTVQDLQTLESVLLILGAAYEYEAVAQAIADGARQLTGVTLVTLTMMKADGSGTMVVRSSHAATALDLSEIEQLPTHIFSLSAEQTEEEEVLPLLHLHGGVAAETPSRRDLLDRFAPHARLALARAQHLAAVTLLAYTDPLTWLANLRGLQIALDDAATRANVEGRSLALLVIDLDDFRRYNALWGHLVGDAALQAFARAICKATRGGDFVARVGGEEFAVLLPDSGEAEARTVAAHIHHAISLGSDGLPSLFTASIGIGIFPNDVPDAFSLYAVADTAMTMAKKAGKNRTFAFETMDWSSR